MMQEKGKSGAVKKELIRVGLLTKEIEIIMFPVLKVSIMCM